MVGRIAITATSPTVSCGQYPARAVTGEDIAVAANVFREGHDAVAADVVKVGGDEIVDEVPTYRGEGRTFL